jgi:hypothetical protein
MICSYKWLNSRIKPIASQHCKFPGREASGSISHTSQAPYPLNVLAKTKAKAEAEKVDALNFACINTSSTPISNWS